jgi:nucleoside-diphosphate-sugar epimerase
MLHAAAQGIPYRCFVEPHVRIPFMAMPDATNALIRLAAAPEASLSQLEYNVTSFSLSAAEIRDLVLAAFPDAIIDYAPDKKRQAIVETWPADLDDTAATQDWKWHPEYDQDRAFNDYLIPNIKKRYSS